MNDAFGSKIKFTAALPTALIVNGLDRFGLELAKTLVAQNGFVIIVGNATQQSDVEIFRGLPNIAIIDFIGVTKLLDEVRRLDYVFYLNHRYDIDEQEVGTQQFLQWSSYLNQILNLAVDFGSLFVFTNSVGATRVTLGKQTKQLLNEAASAKYTLAEFNRYAENLVLEYQAQKNLSAKVLRLGEVIGEGVPLDKDDMLYKLITAAIKRQDLYIEGDGLEGSFYIHVLDAVYGVLKAMFTKDLPKQIYTLAYPEQVTELSLAYRIKDLVPESGIIKFIDEVIKPQIGLKVHRPAAHFEEIGWRPKIPFNTALLQVIAGLRTQLKISGELKQPLIEERRPTPNLQSDSVRIAKSVDALENKQRKLTPTKRFRKGFFRGWDKLFAGFDFLKKITLAEFAVYSILLLIFFGLFFTVLAPVITLARDAFTFDNSFRASINSLQSENWADLETSSRTSEAALTSAQSTLETLTPVFTIAGQVPLQQQLLGLTQSYEFLTSAYRLYATAQTDLEEINTVTTPSIIYRPTNASILALDVASNSTPATNASEPIRNFELAERSYQDYQQVNSQITFATLPEFLSSYFTNKQLAGDEFKDKLAVTEQALKLYELNNSEETVVGIVFTDHLRQTFSGGEVVALGLLKYQNGILKDIRLQPVQNLDLKSLPLSASEKQEINTVNTFPALTGYRVADINTASYPELARLVLNKDTVESLANKAFAKAFGTEVDYTWMWNSTSLRSLLDNYGEVEINGETFNASNYLQNLNSLQKQSLQSRNLLMSNLYGIMLTRLLSTPNQTYANQTRTLLNLIKEGGITTDVNQTALLKLPVAAPDFNVSLYNPETDNYLLNPGVDLNIKVDQEGTSDHYDMTINTANTLGTKFAAVCLPVTIGEITTNLDSAKTQTSAIGGSRCVIANTESNSEFSVGLNRSLSTTKYDASFGAASGLLLRYDWQASFPTKQIDSSTVVTQGGSIGNVRKTQEGSLFYSAEVYNLFRFNIKFVSN